MKLLQTLIYENAVEKGFWSDENPNIPEKLALIHGEVSEALEDYRDGLMEVWFDDDGKPCGFPTELADTVIRCLDLAAHLGIDLGSVMVIKMQYNKGREHMHGGKKC